MFDTGDDTDEHSDTEERGNYEPTQTNRFSEFGILPYIISFCQSTNHTLNETFELPINLVLYVVSYNIQLERAKAEELKKLRK